MAKILEEYIGGISKIYSKGDAREETYYSTLEKLIKNCGKKYKKAIEVTTLPKKTEGGNPDFRIWDGELAITGYIEAKRPDETDLDAVEDSEQAKRYIDTFPNVILTNFLEFRVYRNHNHRAERRISIARPTILTRLKGEPPIEHEEDFFELIEYFLNFTLPMTYTASSLAEELANRTKFLRKQVIEPELLSNEKSKLEAYYEIFEKHLVSGLTKEDFADLFAQTITYGLFAARTRANGKEFNRKSAIDYIPHTVGVLRDTFHFISLEEISNQMQTIIEDISHVLAAAKVNDIIDEYYQKGYGEDPVIPFYEDFLAKYDPEKRESRGVYYTPIPVVRFIVKSIHSILKQRLGRSEGLADMSVHVLDPASGTGTFLAEALKQAVEEHCLNHGDGKKSDFINKHILEHFYGFELLMAPYTLAHLKMSIVLEQLGYKLGNKERFKLYLTNSLEMTEHEQTNMPLVRSIAEESKEALEIKRKSPILVVLGNPPYSGHSANLSEKLEPKRDFRNKVVMRNGKVQLAKTKTWIGEQMEKYKTVDGKKLDEKNPKWLQDDYVKFIRFAQWEIERNGEGILGFITNHSYLDNPTFRGMRQSLMETFDEIYLMDLHGNSLKKEKCPDGGKDENVFAIRQGTAIALMIKFRK